MRRARVRPDRVRAQTGLRSGLGYTPRPGYGAPGPAYVPQLGMIPGRSTRPIRGTIPDQRMCRSQVTPGPRVLPARVMRPGQAARPRQGAPPPGGPSAPEVCALTGDSPHNILVHRTTLQPRHPETMSQPKESPNQSNFYEFCYIVSFIFSHKNSLRALASAA